MKRNLIGFLILMLFIVQHGYSQVLTVKEDFDGSTVSYNQRPSGSWLFNTTYSLPSLSGATVSKSYRGKVPDQVGDTTFLELAIPCDFLTYTHVYLRFDHICKVSPSDITKIQYRRGGALYPWVTIEEAAYTGSGVYDDTRGFNAASYPEWRADDSTIRPTNSWWKEEQFDIGVNVQGDDDVSFRFVIIHGDVPYTQASYGWLLENIQITAARHELHPPIVEFVSPLIKDTVYSTGPWEINARVETSTNARIEVPWLHYTAVIPGSSTVTDSILMTHVSGNAYWKATIPQYIAGTIVSYSITGRDTTGNEATARSWYEIVYSANGGATDNNMIVPQTGNNSYTVYGGIIYPHLGPASGTTGGYGASCNGYSVIYPQGDAKIQVSGTYSTESCCDYIQIYDGIGTGGTMFGQYQGAGTIPTLTSTSGPITIRFYSDGSVQTATNATYWGFTIDVTSIGGIVLDHSAGMHSIDMADTIVVSPTTQVPIVATIKNKGALDLGYVTASYSVNGSAPASKTITFNPSLPWDFNKQDTINTFFPKINGYDTVVIWVTYPNGQYDTATYDDTLTKIIYSIADIYTEWVKTPEDTVYNTGPHEVTARISSFTGTPIGTVYLQVTDTSAGIRNYHTLTMQPQGKDLWSVEIPNIAFFSDVEYLLSITDHLGNVIEISGDYYIKRAGCTTADGSGGALATFTYTGSIQQATFIPGLYKVECWGADGGLGNYNSGTVPQTQIEGGSGGYSVGTLLIPSPTTLYIAVGEKGWDGFQNTTAPGGYNGGGNGSVNSAHRGGGGGGATHVATVTGVLSSLSGNQSAVMIVAGGGGGGGNQSIGGAGGGITGEQPDPSTQFGARTAGGGGTQTAGGVCFTNGSGAAFGQGGTSTQNLAGGGGGGWYGGCTGDNSTGGGGGSGYIGGVTDALTLQVSESGFITSPVADGNGYVRITTVALFSGDSNCLDHSVAMDAILSPREKGDAGTLTPVKVRIRNKGQSDLDSCYINWSLNGVTQPSTVVYRNQNGLPEDFTDTITIGSYPVVMGGVDEIKAWVSLPNGEVDSLVRDDTLQVSSLGCINFAGDILVGAGGTFPTLTDAINSIKDCGVGGDINLQLKGTFTNNVNLSNLSNVLQGHTLTISSYDNHPDSAVIRPTSGTGITLANANNIILKDLKIDVAHLSVSGIELTGGCSDIEVNGCTILVNPTGTGSTVNGIRFNNTSSSGKKLDNIQILNNTISGGYAGVYFNYVGNSGLIGMGNRIDDNHITNCYYSGINVTYYGCFKSISRNAITTRAASASQYAMRVYYYTSVDTMVGNTILMQGTSTNYGMYLYYYINYTSYGATQPALIANNEIRHLSSVSTTYGIYTYYTIADILNNSLYLQGTSTTYGLYMSTKSSTDYLNIQNNIFSVATSGTGYPIYISTASYATQAYNTFLDYNDYYSTGVNVGYIAGAMTTMTALRTATGQDANSVNVLPEYLDVNTDLNLLHDIGLLCPRKANVPTDILGVSRFGTTSMGCYGITPLNGNGMLKEITGLTDGATTGQTENVEVVVYNTGSSPLTDINLGWSVNGVSQGNANYTVNLQRGDFTTITLGSITYPTNNVLIKVWINNLNNGNLADEIIEDDTVNSFINVCQGAYSGVLTVGQGGTFPDVESLYKALDLCGISGDVTAALMPGTYPMTVDLSDNSTLFGNYKLTITSSTGNVNSVTIRPSSGVGIRLDNTNNVEIRGITIDATAGTAGIQFMSACKDIVIRDNKILTSYTATAAASSGIYKASGTGLVDNIRIINNELDGGYAGIYFYAGTGTTAFGTNVRIDSNTVTNTYYYGIYTYYINAKSVSYNTITNDNVIASNTTFHGLHLYYARNGGNVIGNRIHVSDTNIKTTLNGLYTYYIDTAIVANNEVILNSNATTTSGLYIDYPRAVDYVFNSVLVNGTKTTVRALYWYTYANSNYDATLKNNILVANGGTTTRALHLTANVGSYQNNYRLDYNNYYSSDTILGYVGTARVDLAAWQSVMTADTHSVNILPQFVNPANSLELTTASFANDTLLGIPAAGVLLDIQSHFRSLATPSMGAYERPPSGLDGMAWEVHLSEYIAVDKQNISVSLDVLNPGAVALTGATFGWSVNGNVISTTVPYTFTPSLTTYERHNGVPIGNFNASGNIGDVIEVKVWIQSINGMTDTVHWNDTVSKTFTIIPLVEFADPLVGDTTGSLAFDVYATIYEGSGAPVTAPAIYIETIMEGSCSIHDYDTIPMVFQDGKWVANIPKQYYNSKVIYSLHVSDNVGNNVVLKDTVFIEFGGGGGIAPIADFLYTGDVQTVTLPRGTYQIETWGAEGGASNGGGAAIGISKVGGKGGYSVGTITLKSQTTIYVYVGGQGSPQAFLAPGGFNGGGNSGSGTVLACGSGGGASDVRIGSNSLYSRVIVAGGGGAAGFQECNGTNGVISGGAGGGMTGGDPVAGSYATRTGKGASQTAGGAGGTETYGNGDPGRFGIGGNGAASGTTANGGGGGGGWFGGGAGANGSNCAAGGGGGSGWVYTLINENAGYTSSSNIGGTWLLNSAYHLANASTIDGTQTFLAPDGVNETGHSGDGYVRITTISGGGSGDVYDMSHDLAVVELLSPLFNNDSICAPDYLPVQVSLFNLGANAYDFATDSVTLGYEIINPRGGVYSGSVVVNTDSLASGESMEVELMSAMPVLGGTYSIKAWVTSAIDNFICDDTLKTTYTSSKLALPIVENFSTGIPMEIFDTKPGSGTSVWEWYSGSATIQPDSGTGMIRFNGSSGSAAVLTTLQLDLYQASNPFVDFWYYHDTNASEDDYSSYLKVNVRVNEASLTTLDKIYLQDPGGKHGWTYYRYSLNNYTTSNDCIMIQFEAMNNYSDLTQYIDYIRISSEPDAAVSEIIVTPPPALCGQSSSDVLVVIEATRAQSINFGNENLILDISGTLYPVSLQGRTLRGNSSDTILVLSKTTIPFGSTSLKAYFSSPVDNMPVNDTAKLNIEMDPKFTIEIHKLSQTGSPAFAEIEHKQKITIENTGNIDLPAIGLLMKVNSSASDEFPYSFTTRDTLSTNLAVGGIEEYEFTNAYIVPWAKYTVEVYAYLLCDSAAANVMEYVEEDVDVTDLSITAITEPSVSATPDHVGDSLSVSIDILNRNFGRPYNNEVNVVISITDLGGTEKAKIQEEIAFVAAGNTTSYDFKEKYAVPELNKYILKVYIVNTDNYMLNNTVSMERETDLGLDVLDREGNSFIVEQNIPNPAQGKTVINYIIPQDGDVEFKLYSVSGQLLQSRKESARFGDNRIELNLSDYASGIYFYTMEYNGQRITKRMSIKR